MKTPRLVNGDFQIGSGGFEMISGFSKVIQDMGVAVREPYNQDRFHPRYGTILDEFIGRAIGSETDLHVKSEINRTIQNYMVIQSQQIARDQARGRKPRYHPSEIVVGVAEIQVQQAYDRLNVKVVVETQDGQSFDIIRSVAI